MMPMRLLGGIDLGIWGSSVDTCSRSLHFERGEDDLRGNAGNRDESADDVIDDVHVVVSRV